ncbi:hypothetical protein QUB80_14095 [Chlorogloeopsis sp. ULAP01]|nr:hypothetical protein [Chlorogloeopsis sp. ULAP01]MDM9381832.1 hypothetical protein [Chlorogloeopsis sp. ULAP01]
MNQFLELIQTTQVMGIRVVVGVVIVAALVVETVEVVVMGAVGSFWV